MTSKTTHIRVERKIRDERIKLFPEYSDKEIYKIGLVTAKKINQFNEFIWGAENVKKARKK